VCGDTYKYFDVLITISEKNSNFGNFSMEPSIAVAVVAAVVTGDVGELVFVVS
jgi:hypothetical protein